MTTGDPEVRKLSLAFARAVAVAERLSTELDRTVTDLVEYIGDTESDDQPASSPPAPETVVQNRLTAEEADTKEVARGRRRSRRR